MSNRMQAEASLNPPTILPDAPKTSKGPSRPVTMRAEDLGRFVDVVAERAGMRWFVVKTNPRCEERARVSLTEAGFEAFFPILPRLIIHHRTKKALRRDFPMLTGYVFVRLPVSAAQFLFVRGCDGVRDLLGFSGRPQPMSQQDMRLVREVEASEWLRYDRELRFIHPGTRRRRPSKPVFVTSGPFSGFLGEIVDRRARNAVSVLTHVFGRLEKVTVPIDEVASAA